MQSRQRGLFNVLSNISIILRKGVYFKLKKTLIYGGTSSKRPVTGILRKQIVSKSFEGTEKTMKLL